MSENNTVHRPIQERVIRRRHGLVAIDFAELFRYRELLGFLAWRDILVRYKQTAIGIAWAIIQPVLTMLIFTVVFGRMAGLPSEGAPYAVMTFAALLPWQFFSNALTQSSNSVVASASMISKVYFPRLIVPASSVLSGAVDFLVSLVILVGLMVWYHVPIRPELLLLPLFFGLALLASLGTGLWFSALNVKYRDVRHIVPFIVRMGVYVSPVGFSSAVVMKKLGPELGFLYSLNPMVGAIDGFRWAILGPAFQPYWPGFWASTVITVALLVSGAYYFRAFEKTFADII